MDTNILIAEDHPLVREGIKIMLHGLTQDVVLHEAERGQNVVEILDEHPEIDLLLLDFLLPDTDGFDLLKGISDRRPDLPVVVISAFEDSELMRRCLDLGASGFIPKSAPHDVILSALRLVLSGGVYIPPEMMRGGPKDAAEMQQIDQINASVSQKLLGISTPLTERQLQVLKHIAEGQANRDIARLLNVSENTVKVHVAAVLKSLGVTNRTEAVIIAQKLGLIEKTDH